jgi:tetratricopeptide (TPR) repeat protein
MRKALQLSPSLDQMHAHYAYLRILYGEMDEGLEYAEKARDLSPLDPLWAGFSAWLYMLEARWGDAERGIDECLAYTPGYGFCLYTAAQILTAQGRFDEAARVLDAGNPGDPFIDWAKGPTYAFAGRRAEALAVAARLDATETPRNLMHLGFIYSALGEQDRAFDYLERSLDARTDWLPWIVFPNAYGGVIEHLRGQPRYEALLEAFDLPMYR